MTVHRLVLTLLIVMVASRADAEAPALSSAEAAIAGRWRDLTLTRACEPGFRQLMHLAENSQLGNDVVDANIGVFKNYARLELVRAAGPHKLLLLTPKGAGERVSRFFDIEPVEGATAEDAKRVGRALDQVFTADPFELTGQFYASAGGDPIPALADTWRDGDWSTLARVLERRMIALASLHYSLAVIVALAAGFAMSVLLLLGSAPETR